MAGFDLSQYDIQWAIWKQHDRGFPTFDNNPKNLCDITSIELWSWKKLFWIISNKKQILINHARGKIELCFLSP
jgi:hypothetical protein